MTKDDKIPDAWEDDDWEALADRHAHDPDPQLEPGLPVITTRRERLAQHVQQQRDIWESADKLPEPINFLTATTSAQIPFTDFKPTPKLLSRKPTDQWHDPDDEEEKEAQPTPEEVRQRQQLELEDKKRRYQETRAKIWAESSPLSVDSTPSNTSQPEGGGGRGHNRGRGRRGGRGGRGEYRQIEARLTFRGQQAVQGSGFRELYDPNTSPNPGLSLQKSVRDGSALQREEKQAIRGPRGPDALGRGFAQSCFKEG